MNYLGNVWRALTGRALEAPAVARSLEPSRLEPEAEGPSPGRSLRAWRAAPDLSPPAGAAFGFGEFLEAEDLPPHLAVARIPTVYGCIDLIKNALAKLPLRFYLGEEEADNEVEAEPGNVVWLFQNPNPETRNESGFEIIEQICASLDLNGNAYLYLEPDNLDIVREIWTLPAHLTRPVPGPRNTVARFEVRWQGKTFKIPPEQVVHFRYWSPLPGLLGMSPMSAAALSYKTQRLAQRWNFGIYERGGEASGYFTSEAQSIGDEKRERLELSIKQRYRGPENAGRPIVLPRGLKRESSMLTHEQMKFIESYKLTKADVFEVFGIPPWLKGLKEGSSLGDSGAGVDERIFWENCIDPRARRIASTITASLLRRIAPDLRCSFDLSRVFALQKVALERKKSLREALGAPYMTVNEARAEEGLPPLEGEEFDRPPRQSSPFGDPGAAGGPGGSSEPGDKGKGKEPEPKPEEPKDAEKTRAAESRAEELERARRRHDASLARFERRIERHFRRLFNGQESRVVNALEAGVRSATVASVSAGDWTAERLEAEVVRLNREAEAEGLRSFDLEKYLASDDPEELEDLRAELLYILETRGAEALAELALKVDLDVTGIAAADWTRRQAQKGLRDVNETTKAALREKLAEGLQNGESLSQITARVREVFNDRRANAQTIARTETNPAYQFATTSAWQQSGVVEAKVWVAIVDDVTRDAHIEANGDEVPLDEDFEVGGEPLAFPGDPRGSAGNVINCRCGMLAVVKEDSRRSPAARWLSRALPGSRSLAAEPSNRLRSYFATNGHAKHEH